MRLTQEEIDQMLLNDGDEKASAEPMPTEDSSPIPPVGITPIKNIDQYRKATESVGNKYNDLQNLIDAHVAAKAKRQESVGDLNDQEDQARKGQLISDAIGGFVTANRGQATNTDDYFKNLLSRLDAKRQLIGKTDLDTLKYQLSAAKQQADFVKGAPGRLKTEGELSLFDKTQPIAQQLREEYKKALGEKLTPEIADRLDQLNGYEIMQLKKAAGNQGGAEYMLANVTAPDGKVMQRAFNKKTGQYENGFLGQAGFAYGQAIDPVSGNLVQTSKSAPGNTVAVTGQKGLEQVDGKPAEVDYNNLNPKTRTNLKGIKDDLNKDIKDAKDAYYQSQNLQSLMKGGKEIGQDIMRAYQNAFAKATGERGAMTENDVAPFGGRPAILARLERYASMNIKGKLPEEDRKFLTALSSKMAEANQRQMMNRTEQYTQDLIRQIGAQSNVEGKEISRPSVEKILGVPYLTGGKPSPAAPPVDEYIRVMDPQGKTHKMPKANLEKALQKGYKLVQ